MGRDIIQPDIKWEVGNSKGIRIREDRRLLSSKIGGPANHNDPQFVADLINQNSGE